jgi:hypothetical protein
MQVKEIFKNKQKGDYVTIGVLVNLTPESVRKALNDPNNRHHKAVIGAFKQIIEARDAIYAS